MEKTAQFLTRGQGGQKQKGALAAHLFYFFSRAHDFLG